uniref:uncharacterized protein isoform X2 n=1 Tax=Myxine glutinosa TaxID=7769 RepID=UPI0035901E73
METDANGNTVGSVNATCNEHVEKIVTNLIETQKVSDDASFARQVTGSTIEVGSIRNGLGSGNRAVEESLVSDSDPLSFGTQSEAFKKVARVSRGPTDIHGGSSTDEGDEGFLSGGGRGAKGNVISAQTELSLSLGASDHTIADDDWTKTMESDRPAPASTHFYNTRQHSDCNVGYLEQTAASSCMREMPNDEMIRHSQCRQVVTKGTQEMMQQSASEKQISDVDTTSEEAVSVTFGSGTPHDHSPSIVDSSEGEASFLDAATDQTAKSFMENIFQAVDEDMPGIDRRVAVQQEPLEEDEQETDISSVALDDEAYVGRHLVCPAYTLEKSNDFQPDGKGEEIISQVQEDIMEACPEIMKNASSGRAVNVEHEVLQNSKLANPAAKTPLRHVTNGIKGQTEVETGSRTRGGQWIGAKGGTSGGKKILLPRPRQTTRRREPSSCATTSSGVNRPRSVEQASEGSRSSFETPSARSKSVAVVRRALSKSANAACTSPRQAAVGTTTQGQARAIGHGPHRQDQAPSSAKSKHPFPPSRPLPSSPATLSGHTVQDGATPLASMRTQQANKNVVANSARPQVGQNSSTEASRHTRGNTPQPGTKQRHLLLHEKTRSLPYSRRDVIRPTSSTNQAGAKVQADVKDGPSLGLPRLKIRPINVSHTPRQAKGTAIPSTSLSSRQSVNQIPRSPRQRSASISSGTSGQSLPAILPSSAGVSVAAESRRVGAKHGGTASDSSGGQPARTGTVIVRPTVSALFRQPQNDSIKVDHMTNTPRLVEWSVASPNILLALDALCVVLQYFNSQHDFAVQQRKQVDQQLELMQEKLDLARVQGSTLGKACETLSHRLQEELGKAKAESQVALQAFRAELGEQLESQREQLEQERSTHVNSLGKRHHEQLEELLHSHKTQLQEMGARHKKQLNTLKEQHSRILEDVEKAQNAERKNLKEEFEKVRLDLQDQVDTLIFQKEALQDKARRFEAALQRGTEEHVQEALAPYQHIQQELQSLRAVLELRNSTIHELQERVLQLQDLEEANVALKEQTRTLRQQNEELRMRANKNSALARQLSFEQSALQQTLQKESKTNRSLSMENEELLWRIHNDNPPSPSRCPTSNFPLPSVILRPPPASAPASPTRAQYVPRPVVSRSSVRRWGGAKPISPVTVDAMAVGAGNGTSIGVQTHSQTRVMAMSKSWEQASPQSSTGNAIFESNIVHCSTPDKVDIGNGNDFVCSPTGFSTLPAETVDSFVVCSAGKASTTPLVCDANKALPSVKTVSHRERAHTTDNCVEPHPTRSGNRPHSVNQNGRNMQQQNARESPLHNNSTQMHQ